MNYLNAKTKIIINGNSFNTKEQIHQFLKKELDFPDYYGGNLDALWDCLTDLIISGSLSIIWTNYNSSISKLGDYAVKLKKLFEDLANKDKRFHFSYR